MYLLQGHDDDDDDYSTGRSMDMTNDDDSIGGTAAGAFSSSPFHEQFIDDDKEDGWPTMTKMVHPLKMSAITDAGSTFNNTLVVGPPPPPTKRNAVMAHSA